MGGELCYRKHAILLYPVERAKLEYRGRGRILIPLTIFVLGEGVKGAERELEAIRRERLNLLETSPREAILILLRLLEEQKRELESAIRRKVRRESWESYEEAVTGLSMWLYGEAIEPILIFRP